MKISREETVDWLHKVEFTRREFANKSLALIPTMRSEGSLAPMLVPVAQDSRGMVLCAQSRWVLENDLSTAFELLGKIPPLTHEVIHAIRNMPAAMAGQSPWDGYKFEYHSFNAVLVGLLLGGAREEFTQLCGAIVTCPDGFVAASRKHVVGEFVAQLAEVGAGINDRIALAAFERTEAFDSGHFVYGYHEMLLHLAHGNATEFERVRAVREAAFPERVRKRPGPSKLDMWGYGKIAQGLTFDALGVALCRLAVWRGMPVSVNNKLYPRQFYAELVG